MSILQITLVWISSLLMLMGALGLVATWVTPSILDRPFPRWLITGNRMAPTRANRTLMSLWALLIGCYLVLSVLGHGAASFLVLAIWLPLALMVLRRLRFPADEG